MGTGLLSLSEKFGQLVRVWEILLFPFRRQMLYPTGLRAQHGPRVITGGHRRKTGAIGSYRDKTGPNYRPSSTIRPKAVPSRAP